MEVSEGERVTVRLSSREPVRARIAAEPPPGFRVCRADLASTLEAPDAGLRIGTSRHGAALSVARLGPLAERIGADGATVAFGAPERGLPAMLGLPPAAIGADAGETDAAGEADTADTPSEPDRTDRLGDRPGGFDRWLDTIPNQGTATVRTEEALFATLACLNLR
jgi:hypothetical protein